MLPVVGGGDNFQVMNRIGAAAVGTGQRQMMWRLQIALLCWLTGGWAPLAMGQALLPNAAEEYIAQRAMNHPDQGRTSMVYDPYLHLVARAKALDLGRRGYFAHVDPDGYGPNEVIRMTGYQLPSHYSSGLSGNNVESLSAGRAAAEDAFVSWMNSPGHRRHVLGEIDFYRGQTHYGVGYAEVAGSPYRHYYVFITAPPSRVALGPLAAQTVNALLTMTPAQIAAAPGILIAGTSTALSAAADQSPPQAPELTSPRTVRRSVYVLQVVLRDDTGVTRVQYRTRAPGTRFYEPWTARLLAAAPGEQQWSARLRLNRSGKWRIQIRASDAAGRVSPVSTLSVRRK